jgi:hypothetical protein
MSGVKRTYLQDANLGPIHFARVKQSGKLIGVEIAFEESAPLHRNRLVFHLWCLAGCAGILGALGVMIFGANAAVLPTKLWGGLIGAGIGLAVFCFWKAIPPFRSQVALMISGAADQLTLTRDGRCVATARLSELRGVSIEPHPKLDDYLVRLQRRPGDASLRTEVSKLQRTESVFLHLGSMGATQRKLEVAAFYGREKARTSELALQVRSAIEAAYHAAQMGEKLLPADEPEPLAAAPQLPGPRRRRGRLD